MANASLVHPPAPEETDVYFGEIPARVPKPIIKELSAIDELRTVAALLSEWGAIIAAVFVFQRYASPWMFPVAVIWIGARQHALAVLMHDGAHYHLFRNRTLNNAVSELFLAWPLFVTTRAYRDTHFAHHCYVNTEKDPDFVRKQNSEWEFPKSWKNLATMLLKDVCGLNTHQQLMEASDLGQGGSRKTDPYTMARYAYYGVMVAGVTYFQVWPAFLLFWMVPILTWLKMILRIRSIAEHYSVEDDHVYTRTRTTLPSLFERLFVAPRNIGYHLEHHLYPTVPFYRLPRLHALLMADEDYRSRAHLTTTYWGVLRECVSGGR